MKDSTCVLNLHIDAEFALPYQLPSISYGLIAWGQAAKTHLNKILLIQKRVVRLMNFAKFSVHAVPLFISANILPLPLLYFKNCSILMHDVYNKVVPSNSSNLFTPTKDVHHHNTCSSTAGDVYINNSRLNPALQELFFHYGRKYLEQCIPDVMKQLPKYRLKKKIIESLLRIFLKTGFLSWYRYVYKWNEKNLNFSFVNKKDLNFSCFYLSSSFLSLL